MATSPTVTFTFFNPARIALAASKLDQVLEAFNTYTRAGYPNPFTVETTDENGKAIAFIFFKHNWDSRPEIKVGILAQNCTAAD